MSILITADLHLTARPAEDYRFAVFPFLARQAEKRGAKTLAILGDLTDRKDLHPSRLVNRIVRELTALPFDEVFWVIGNHDFADPTEPFFQFIKNVRRIRFIMEPTRAVIDGTPTLLLPNTKDPLVEWEKIEPSWWAEAKLVLMHQPVFGAQASNGTKITEGEGIVTYLRKKTKAPIVSGDIHGPQEVGPVLYAGAPHPVHFGDAYDPRVLLFGDDRTLTSIPRRTIRRRTLNITAVAELADADIRTGDHLKINVALPRSAYGTWPSVKKELAEQVKLLGAELFCAALVGTEEKAAKLDGAPSVAVAARKPERTIERFLEASGADPLLLEAGKALYAKVPTSSYSRKPGDLNFKRLVIEGFKSFREPTTLRFDNKAPGLYLLSGRNEEEPRLGANGTGKSTCISDAPSWCLWGKTSRGVFGPSVMNWAGDHRTSVAMEFEKAGADFALTRTQKPNSVKWVGGGEAIDPSPDELTARLGLSLDEFLLSGLLSQSGQYFLDMGHMERLDVFSSALGLRAWDDAADVAGVEAKMLGEKLVAAKAEVTRREGALAVRVETVAAALLELEKAELVAKSAKDVADLARLADLVQEAEQSLSRSQLKLSKLREAQTALVTTVESVEGQITKLDREVIQPAQLVVSKAEARYTTLKSAKAKLISAGECPSCKQEVSAKYVERLQVGIDKEIAEAKQEAEATKQKLRILNAKRTELDASIAEKRAERRRLGDEVMQAERTAAQRATAVESERGALRAARGAVDAAQASTERASKALAAARTAEGTAKAVLEAASVSVATLEKLSGPIEFWRKGFRDLRFWLIRSALEELTIESNNNLSALGLEGWSITFDVERITGSKTVERGFHVFISSPSSPPNTPWEAWSGGESQRLRLAVAFALSSLIGARTGVSTNLLVVDEPTQHLSEEGVQDVLTFLADRARMSGKMIWVIDHNKSSQGSFAGEYTVVKTASGSKIKRVTYGQGE